MFATGPRRRKGLEFVCVFGHDERVKSLWPDAPERAGERFSRARGESVRDRRVRWRYRDTKAGFLQFELVHGALGEVSQRGMSLEAHSCSARSRSVMRLESTSLASPARIAERTASPEIRLKL